MDVHLLSSPSSSASLPTTVNTCSIPREIFSGSTRMEDYGQTDCHPARPRVRGVPEPDDFDRLELLVAHEHDGALAPHVRGQPQPGPRLSEVAVGVALPS